MKNEPEKKGSLCLKLKDSNVIMIGENIKIELEKVGLNTFQLRITAPLSINIYRDKKHD